MSEASSYRDVYSTQPEGSGLGERNVLKPLIRNNGTVPDQNWVFIMCLQESIVLSHHIFTINRTLIFVPLRVRFINIRVLDKLKKYY